MGIRLFVEVLDHAPTTLTHREKLVLAVLAEDSPDETRVTWSSVESPTILRRAKVTRPQMYEVLKALIAKGTLKKVSAGQRHGTAKYAILPLTPQGLGFPDTDPQSQRPDSADTDAASQHPEIPDTDASQCPENPDVSVRESRTPTPSTPKRVISTAPPATADPAPDPFDAFWSAYPRKVAKGTARRAWSAALKRGADPAHIAAAAARHAAQWRAAHTEARFIPYPATWLNGERYDDALDPIPNHNQPPLPGAPQRYTDPAERGIF